MEKFSNIIFTEPQFIEKPLAWIEHIPFAFFLVEKLKPNTIVELGTHYGNSYFAFCQAIKELKISTKAYAIDSWTGDEHAGFYGNEVFNYVNKINNEHFSYFSNLIKATFDEASQFFENGSVDLLHVDGLHTYEAVKHDFENWLPKMSDKGVILFHDTVVKERGFGVWKLVEEISTKYPYFQFEHGYGLGVLCVGKNVDAKFLEFVSKVGSDSFTQKLFENAGKRIWFEQQFQWQKSQLEVFSNNISANNQTIKLNENQIEELRKKVYLKESDIDELGTQLHALQQNLQIKDTRIADLQDQINELNTLKNNNDHLKDKVNAISVENERMSRLITEKDHELTKHKRELSHLGSVLHDQSINIQHLHLLIDQITKSVSWKFTAPLRYLKRKVKTNYFFINSNIKLIEKSELFDEKYYLENNPDVVAFGMLAAKHYLLFGGFEGRNPSNNFDTFNYLKLYPDVKASGLNPLWHYLKFGKQESRQIPNEITHKINYKNTSSFHPEGVLSKIKKKLITLYHIQLILRSKLFDSKYYLSNNHDVKLSKISPVKHFLNFGWKEGRNPSQSFDINYYLSTQVDVSSIGINPLVHYIRFGKKEGRLIKSPSIEKNASLSKGSFFNTSNSDKTKLLSDNQSKSSIPHFAPPIDDYSLIVPFKYNAPVIDPPPQIAVICHLFYTDLLGEIAAYLSNIPFSYDLYISTDTEEKKKIITSGLSNWKKGRLQIKLAMNRGRDIAPKLILWPEVYKNYDFFLHIHSKKTVQESVLSGWRKHLFETLLGSPEIITSIFQAFNSNQKLGIIAPQHYSNIRHAIGWGYNYKEASLFAEQLGIKISLDDPIDFPSGSMFWARSEAISPLLKTGLRFEDFPEENGQIDNTLAHVIERMYFFVCEKAGYDWIKIVNPMQSPNTDNCLEIRDQSELYSTINRIINPLTHYRKVYINSPYSNLNFEEFVKQMELHIAGKDSSIDFDEGFYLSANKDLAKLISTGLLDSGFSHYCLSGKNENRLWSNHLIKRKYQLDPKYPDGFYSPTNIKPKQFYKPLARNLVKSKEPFLLILFAHLQSDLFYAGYTAFFKDFLPVFDQFEKIVISVESDFYEAKLAKRFNPKIEVINQSQLYNLKTIPDLILCFSNQLFTKAFKLFSEPKKIVYYCQEYEAGFFPFGSEFIEAEKAITNSKNIIISTVLLRNFLEKKNLLNDKQIFVTTPKIEPVNIKPGNWNKLFFYFRPEFFHARNIPEILWETVHEFCQKHRGYEIYMVGSIETRFSFEINGNPIFVLNKLPTEQYNELIATCDVVIAMIYSAHPGVIAFQAAASGIPTVTNIFDNRDAETLKKISKNIVPFDPVNDQLLDKIELALSMPKGNKSFDQELYSGKKGDLTLSEFILKICNH